MKCDRVYVYLTLVLVLFLAGLACNAPVSMANFAYKEVDGFGKAESEKWQNDLYDQTGAIVVPDPGDPMAAPDEQTVNPDDSAAAPPGPVPPASPSSDGTLKPVGFLNYGTINAVVRPWTWLPLGSEVRDTPVSASTVSSANDGIGDWPNSSRYLSLPMGSYTWCIDWEEGDIDEDGQMDYSHYFIDEPTILDENDSDELEFAEEVSISSPPTAAAVYVGRCGAPPAPLCTGETKVSAQVIWASTTDNPPDFFAYANPEVRASPPGVSISYGGSTSGFDSARILLDQGAWIQASTSLPLHGMGVQIMGDQYIGWARVLFDGAEIWRGDTAHTWNDGANYGEYVEVRCFPPGEHTLTVENLGMEGGYGGTTVPISWYAFRR